MTNMNNFCFFQTIVQPPGPPIRPPSPSPVAPLEATQDAKQQRAISKTRDRGKYQVFAKI
jgi:hypothetical protein